MSIRNLQIRVDDDVREARYMAAVTQRGSENKNDLLSSVRRMPGFVSAEELG